LVDSTPKKSPSSNDFIANLNKKTDGCKNGANSTKVGHEEYIENCINNQIKVKKLELKENKHYLTDSFTLYDEDRFSKENGTYLFDTYNYYKAKEELINQQINLLEEWENLFKEM